jgi:hypothetical protein
LICAVVAYISLRESGCDDVLIACTVFLPFALLLSAASIAMNARLLRDQFRMRLPPGPRPIEREDEALPQASGRPLPLTPLPLTARAPLHWPLLVHRFVLHRDRQKHNEKAFATEIEAKHLGMSMMLLLAEDVPFFIIKTVLLVRTVYEKDDVAVLKRFCSASYKTGPYVFILLDTMKTAGMMATKLMKVRSFPALWAKRRALQAEARTLALRLEEIAALEMAALSTTGGMPTPTSPDGEAGDAGARGSPYPPVSSRTPLRTRTRVAGACSCGPVRSQRCKLWSHRCLFCGPWECLEHLRWARGGLSVRELPMAPATESRLHVSHTASSASTPMFLADPESGGLGNKGTRSRKSIGVGTDDDLWQGRR